MPTVTITVRPAEVVRRFGFAKSTLRPAQVAIVDRAAARIVARWRSHRPVRLVRLVGNSDRQESSPDLLGRRRALAVRHHLIAALEKRVPGLARRIRIVAQSLGASRPVADSTTLAGRQRNRRVLIYFSGVSASPTAPTPPAPTPPAPTPPAPSPPAPAPTPAPSSTSRFPADIIQAARASQQRWQVPASITLAQWALESGFGKHMPSGSNNPFGIKAGKNAPFVEANTVEVINGQRVTVRAKFRKFDSIADAFDYHGRLLATNKAYTRAMNVRQDPDAFADALTGVYATAPNYGSVLKSMMKKYNLYQYNQ
jgi:hypothetical protein